MKIKDDILKWREETHKLNLAVEGLNKQTESYAKEIRDLKETVEELVKITEEMTETMLTLIRQQIGD